MSVAVCSFPSHAWLLRTGFLLSLVYRFRSWTEHRSVAGEQLDAGGKNERMLWSKSYRKFTITFDLSCIGLRCSANFHTHQPVCDSNPRSLDRKSAALTCRSFASTRLGLIISALFNKLSGFKNILHGLYVNPYSMKSRSKQKAI